MKKIILSLVLAVLLIPIAAQAFQYSIKFKNEPYSKKTYYIGKTKLIMRVVYFSFTYNNHFDENANAKTNILPILKIDAKNSNHPLLQCQALQLLAWMNYKLFITPIALHYVNIEIQKIHYLLKMRKAELKPLQLEGILKIEKIAFGLRSQILIRQKAVKLYVKGFYLERAGKYRQGRKYIKESAILQPKIIKIYSKFLKLEN